METNIALCTYRVSDGKEAEFKSLLAQHWPALRKFGLVADEPSVLFRGKDESGKTFFVEILTWKSKEGPDIAEQTPEIMAIWERMGVLTEARLGRPPMEFPIVERLATP
jgi:hypothetical protein